MLKYLVKRILLAIPTLFGITVITFLTMALSPGDPALIAAGAGGQISNDMSQEAYQLLRKEMLLDEPVMMRYWYWLAGHPKKYDENGNVINVDRTKGVLRGDFGVSMAPDRRLVTDKMFGGEDVSFWRSRFWATMSLAILAIGSSMLLAIPIGIVQAVKQDSAFDKISSTILYGLYSVPSYVMALPLILLFAVKLEWLPFQGMMSEGFNEMSAMGQVWDLIKHYILIGFCSSFGAWAYYSRFVRQNMLEVLRQDYIRTARAKGVAERDITVKHAFRNTLIPVATLIGMILPAIVGGSVILETMFAWNGMGKLMYDSFLIRDYNTVMALTLITAFLVLLGTLLADLSYGLIDPRVKYD